jgi:hypothetical protein
MAGEITFDTVHVINYMLEHDRTEERKITRLSGTEIGNRYIACGISQAGMLAARGE